MALAENSEQPTQQLLRLAALHFGQLGQAECRLICSASRGLPALCGTAVDLSDPSNDPFKADQWGAEREVRADLIALLCGDPQAARHISPKGIQLVAAKITGLLDLSCARVPFPLFLMQCRASNGVMLRSAHLCALFLNGSWVGWVNGDGARVEGNVFLKGGFRSEGLVSLNGAQVGGSLECDGGTFNNFPQENVPSTRTALNVDGANVKGNVFLRDKFAAQGEVRLIGAQIGGVLDCGGGTFENLAEKGVADSGRALSADYAEVRIGVFLNDRFRAEGEVRLHGAHIGGHLNCDAGAFANPPQNGLIESGKAFTADGAEIRGSIFLRNGFRAEGTVSLAGARVEGSLCCAGAAIECPLVDGVPQPGKALVANRAAIRGGISFGEGFVASGEVQLMATQTEGDVDCEGAKLAHFVAQRATIEGGFFLRRLRDPIHMTIDIKDLSTGVLVDEQESWPAAGNLYLDGFKYGRIAKGPTDAQTRLRWLRLQPEFAPQPFRQLARVLREMGDDRGARQVLYEMERLRWAQQLWVWRHRLREEKLSWPRRLKGRAEYALGRAGGWLLGATIGYGFRLLRTLCCILGLTILGAVLFHYGYQAGAMTPAEEKAHLYFQQHHEPPPYQQQFMCIVYSLENSVPFLRLGQDGAWTPDPAPRSTARWWLTWPTLLRFYRRLEIVFGWVLATLFVAGVTGVVRRE